LALPAGAPLLHSGDDVRVGGEPVGQVSSVALAAGSGRASVATLSLASGRVGPGASARIRPRGLAGAVYVDLDPGQAQRPWPSGSLIRTTTGGVQLSDVVSGFDADARRALQRVLTGYGTGFAGRGVAANQAIAQTPALLGNLTAVLHALSPQPGALSGLIGSARTVLGALAPRADTTLAGLTSAARLVIETTGSHAAALAATIRSVPPLERTSAGVLPATDALLARLTVAARTLSPGVAALGDALPGIQTIEHDGPAVTVLAAVARTAAPALHALTPTLSRLRGPAAGLPALSAPAAQLATVLIPYRTELIQAPLGFTRWGDFRYDFGTAPGHRAVRFSMILTCAYARDPYPPPGAAGKERKSCP
jgi:phospholipid/cholesterol/gamma-HCH transport system substrate-binding protein